MLRVPILGGAMFISESTAKNLIREISSVIDYDINIMNEKGAIIASTNPSRTGQYHEGAYRIIKDNLDELIVFYDGEYDGCKKGINLPINLNGSIIGAIGITGEVSEIMKYGNLIRKVTEILIKDLFKLQQLQQKELEKQAFVNSWLNGDLESRLEIERGMEKYSLNKYSPFVVAIIKDLKENIFIEPTIHEKLNQKGILTTYSNGLGIIISNLQSAQKSADYISSVLELYAESFVGAVGTCQSDFEGVPKSYREARQVLQLKENAKKGIYLFDDELFHVIINDVSAEYQLRFTGMVFSSCTNAEISDFIHFIQVYYQNNGSINSIAAELFVHKNTVQYKINKIHQRTGLDLRKLSDLTQLYLAATWRSSIE